MDLNLVKYKQDGLELYINKYTHEVWTTQAALVRMTGKVKQTISQFKGVNKNDLKKAEIGTPGGLKVFNYIMKIRL